MVYNGECVSFQCLHGLCMLRKKLEPMKRCVCGFGRRGHAIFTPCESTRAWGIFIQPCGFLEHYLLSFIDHLFSNFCKYGTQVEETCWQVTTWAILWTGGYGICFTRESAMIWEVVKGYVCAISVLRFECTERDAARKQASHRDRGAFIYRKLEKVILDSSQLSEHWRLRF